ncbi:glycoside hydrolase family 15 protein [Yinghuangia aomiensis]
MRAAALRADPRTEATLVRVRRDLLDDGYVYRFRHGDAPLGDREGAFLLCGFMLVLAEASQGEQEAAVRRFERTRAACGAAGMFAEEYDVAERQLRGNLPQAFVHALLLESSVVLGSGREAGERGESAAYRPTPTRRRLRAGAHPSAPTRRSGAGSPR